MKNGRYVFKDGTEVWHKDGKVHREDGPAITHANGYKSWYKYGELHRIDGPARTWPDGSEWWVNGMLHREDGPTGMWEDGEKQWWVNDNEFRVDDPDIINFFIQTIREIK
jgi:hypothetical protein